MMEQPKGNLKRIFLCLGIGFLIFGVGAIFVKLPSVTALESTQAVITGFEQCRCSGSKGNSSGYIDVYEFSHRDQTYTNKGDCSCFAFRSLKAGQKTSVLFDANAPNKSIQFKSLGIFFVFLVVGLFALLVYKIAAKIQKDLEDDE